MSVQLDQYLQMRADGQSLAEASIAVGMTRVEAELTEKAIAGGHLSLPKKSAAIMPEEGITTTIRVGDGPKLSMEAFKDAVNKMRPSRKSAPAGDRIRLIIERIERIEDEKKGLTDDIADVFKEAKSNGYDTKTLKRIVKLRKMEPHEQQEAEALMQTYMNAIGMTPIEAAIALVA